MRPESAQSFSVGSATLRFAVPRVAGEWAAEAGGGERQGGLSSGQGGCGTWAREGQRDSPRSSIQATGLGDDSRVSGISKGIDKSKCLIIGSMEGDEKESAGFGGVLPSSRCLFLPCCFLAPVRRDCVMKWQGQAEVPQEGPGESGFLLLLVLRTGLQMKVAAAVAVAGLP